MASSNLYRPATHHESGMGSPSRSTELLLVAAGQSARHMRHAKPDDDTVKHIPSRGKRATISIPTSSEVDLRFSSGLVNNEIDLSEPLPFQYLDNPKLRWPSAGPHDPTPRWHLEGHPIQRPSPNPHPTNHRQLRISAPLPPSLHQCPPRVRTSVAPPGQPPSPRSPTSPTRAFTKAWKHVSGALRKPDRRDSMPQGFEVVSPTVPISTRRTLPDNVRHSGPVIMVGSARREPDVPMGTDASYSYTHPGRR